MYNFIALAWNPADALSTTIVERLLGSIRALQTDYRSTANDDGFVVLHDRPDDDAMRTYVLPGGLGVILGRLFPIQMDDWHADWSWSPSQWEATQMLQTKGQWLIEHMWGSYVAFLRDPVRKDTFVIRDCSGKLPCYRLRHPQVDVFFADPALLPAIGFPRASLNWGYLAGFLCCSQLQIRETALEGVTELLAGDRFQRSSSGICTHDCAWSPWEIFRRPMIHDFTHAVERARAITVSCIRAWGSIYDTIILNLSGGLDSTVVLASLLQDRRRPEIVCANRFGAKRAEDERSFARLAAAMGDVTLLEIPIVPETRIIDDALTHLPVTAKPTVPGTIGVLELALLQDLSRRFRACSIWTGQGGDHLFMQTPVPFGPVDYLAINGLRLGFLRTLRDAARLSHLNYWRLIGLLWEKDFERATSAIGGARLVNHPFLTQEGRARTSLEYLTHPWMVNSESLPPGRRFQTAALCEVLNRHRPLPGLQSTFEHHPLLSQPLIELCLSIPSNVHLFGGSDRAVERAAFADLIPDRIAARSQKGQSTFSILETIHRSAGYLRALLLDGSLAREGILDRAALEPYVTGQRPVDVTTFWPLLSCIAAELWIGNWLNSGWSASELSSASQCSFDLAARPPALEIR